MLPPKASKDAASSDGGVSAALCCVIARWRGGIVLSAATAGSHRCSFMLDVSLGVIENLYVSLSHVYTHHYAELGLPSVLQAASFTIALGGRRSIPST